MLFFDYLEVIEELSDEERGRLLTALLNYARHGMEPENAGSEKFAFKMMKAQFDRDREAYEKKCKKNAESQKRRWQNMSKLSDTDVYERIQPYTNEYERYQYKDKDKDKDNSAVADTRARAGAGGSAAGFERFWKIYPRRVAKKNALVAWKDENAGEQIDEILESVRAALRSDQWRDGRYIPYPETWLRGRRWEDEVGAGADRRHRKPTEAEKEAVKELHTAK